MLEAIVLGLLQGVTEFLPVSSSGHLVVVPYLLGWSESPSLAFDVALHFGTLLALVVFFAGDLWWLTTRTLGVGSADAEETVKARRTVGLLSVGTVPAALAGYLGEDFFTGTFQRPRLVAGFLLLTGVILVAGEWLRRRRAAAILGKDLAELTTAERLMDPGRHEGTTGWTDAGLVGLAQALAIFPGISRSGATMAAGMARGLSREAAARFSFLLSIPIILGATLVQLGDLLAPEAVTRSFSDGEVAVGVLVAAGSGYWAIRYLLRLVVNEELTGFARYVILLAALTFIGTLWLGPPSSL